jgi:hypothetical protein
MALAGEALVALLVGLVLAPVGAAIGSALLFGAGLWVFGDHPPSSSEIIGMTFYGTIPGLVLATPVTAIALPIIYGMMRRRSALSLRGLIITGAACGFLSVVTASLLIWLRSGDQADTAYWKFMLGVALDGAVVAAICANWFGRMMRAYRPQGWQDAAAKPAA